MLKNYLGKDINKECKYIIYLEPSCTSELYKSIMELYNKTEILFGRNDAHKYHPHVSLCGFFEIPNCDNYMNYFKKVLISSIMKNNNLRRPYLKEVKVSNRSVYIEIDLDPHLKRSIDDFRRTINDECAHNVPEYKLREKPMDHISLSYRVAEDLPKFILEKIYELSCNHLEQHLKKDVDDTEWEICFYEVEKSSTLSSHVFFPLKRWKLD
jgi:hypothetical protein